ncbi:unnamed protein product [Brassicogethes aeneus]|uniref:HORMA domain-containing protein n=1 Tax=Brassicogethes aeneus TaxID=1431903 RepID=A0A9P0BAM0_BRAAE|nr:unnamed protein product [Brassicogethes aeneus]
MKMSTSSKDRFSADILCEFFEVVVHSILYSRKIYPEAIFVQKRKYGTVVYQSVHPEINEYITESLKAVNFHARKNQLKKLFVCFHTDTALYEKYVFDVLDIKNILERDTFLVDLEQAFRTFYLKLHSSNFYLKDLPDDATFSVRLMTSAYSSVEFNQQPLYEDFPWTEVTDQENIIEPACIVPIYTIEKDFLTLQMYIEKSADVY